MHRLPVLTRLERDMASTPSSRLLSLPYEIREMIYKLLLVSEQWIIVETRCDPSTQQDKLYCYQLPNIWIGAPSDTGWSAQFLRVCKLFHAQASRILYERNKFEMALRIMQQTFLPTIGQTNASYIRYLELAQTELGSFKATYTIPAVLSSLPSLRCLYFTPTVQGLCNSECRYFCRHTPSQLKIVVLRLARLIITTHPHLKWFQQFECFSPYESKKKFYKLSDDEGNKHPPRPREHPDYLHRLSNPRPHPDSHIVGEVLDVEEQLAKVKVIKVRTGRIIHRTPASVPDRPAWRY